MNKKKRNLSVGFFLAMAGTVFCAERLLESDLCLVSDGDSTPDALDLLLNIHPVESNGATYTLQNTCFAQSAAFASPTAAIHISAVKGAEGTPTAKKRSSCVSELDAAFLDKELPLEASINSIVGNLTTPSTIHSTSIAENKQTHKIIELVSMSIESLPVLIDARFEEIGKKKQLKLQEPQDEGLLNVAIEHRLNFSFNVFNFDTKQFASVYLLIAEDGAESHSSSHEAHHQKQRFSIKEIRPFSHATQQPSMHVNDAVFAKLPANEEVTWNLHTPSADRRIVFLFTDLIPFESVDLDFGFVLRPFELDTGCHVLKFVASGPGASPFLFSHKKRRLSFVLDAVHAECCDAFPQFTKAFVSYACIEDAPQETQGVLRFKKDHVMVRVVGRSICEFMKPLLLSEE